MRCLRRRCLELDVGGKAEWGGRPCNWKRGRDECIREQRRASDTSTEHCVAVEQNKRKKGSIIKGSIEGGAATLEEDDSKREKRQNQRELAQRREFKQSRSGVVTLYHQSDKKKTIERDRESGRGRGREEGLFR